MLRPPHRASGRGVAPRKGLGAVRFHPRPHLCNSLPQRRRSFAAHFRATDSCRMLCARGEKNSRRCMAGRGLSGSSGLQYCAPKRAGVTDPEFRRRFREIGLAGRMPALPAIECQKQDEKGELQGHWLNYLTSEFST